MYNDELKHYGVKGMKWGKRSRTAALRKNKGTIKRDSKNLSDQDFMNKYSLSKKRANKRIAKDDIVVNTQKNYKKNKGRKIDIQFKAKDEYGTTQNMTAKYTPSNRIQKKAAKRMAQGKNDNYADAVRDAELYKAFAEGMIGMVGGTALMVGGLTYAHKKLG